jgi:hypothetical protein
MHKMKRIYNLGDYVIHRGLLPSVLAKTQPTHHHALRTDESRRFGHNIHD